MPRDHIVQPSKRKLIYLTILLLVIVLPCAAITIQRAAVSLLGKDMNGIVVSESSRASTGDIYRAGRYYDYVVTVDQDGTNKSYELRQLNQDNLDIGDPVTVRVFGDKVAPQGFDWLLIFGAGITLTLLALITALVKKYFMLYRK